MNLAAFMRDKLSRKRAEIQTAVPLRVVTNGDPRDYANPP